MRLTLLAVVAAVCLFTACNNNSHTPDDHTGDSGTVNNNKIFIRKNIYTLDSTSKEIASLRKGVEVMMKRPATDPTSWAYQAHIHGTKVTPVKPGWNACQHASFFFLSWHRMYLYYLERILRKASGDTSFALPYWNYSDNPAQRIMPYVFRKPRIYRTGDSNYLFVPDRNARINAGDSLSLSAVQYKESFKKIIFTTSDNLNPGFGGLTVKVPSHGGGPFGVLENQPHNQIHVQIGGWMAYPSTAAQDPIFWLHHANIDRLWVNWLSLGGGRSNTSDSIWLNTRFLFFNENKDSVFLTGQQIVNTASLGYKYDDAGVAPAPSDIIECQPPVVKQDTLPPLTLLKTGPMDVKGLRTKIGFPKNKEAVAEFSKTGRQFVLDFNGITYASVPTGVYEVYINLPAGIKDPQPSDIHYAGNIGLFGVMDHHGMPGMEAGGEVVLDITDLVCKLVKKHENMSDISLTIILRGLSPAKGEKALLPTGSIKIRETRVIRL